ncbi:MAG: hypothetical protein RSD64_00855, partial [Christensenellaceae bacterium]
EACIAGEKYMYLYFKKSGKVENGQEINGEIAFELVDNVNVMFADEQERDIQKQPYVLLISRKLVRDVKNEAKQNCIPKSEIDFIISDEATDLQSGDSAKKEVKNDDKKCLCIVKLFKEDGKVYVEKSTKSVVYQKKTLLGLTNYPIAKFVWSDKKGSCRGEGDVYRYIPNQIWVNKLEAYRLLSAKLFAFPKLIHSDRIANKNAITDVGVALEVKDDGINAVTQRLFWTNSWHTQSRRRGHLTWRLETQKRTIIVRFWQCRRQTKLRFPLRWNDTKNTLRTWHAFITIFG